MPDIDIKWLTAKALEKKKLIKEFLSLTEEQERAIAHDNYDSIFRIINEKQSIIEKINIIDLELRETAPENRGVINEITRETKVIMSQAIALDTKNIQKLKANQVQIAQELKAIRKQRNGHNTYRGKNTGIEGILLDKKK